MSTLLIANGTVVTAGDPEEIPRVINEHGINSFKTFMAYKGALMIDDRQMFELMKELVIHGAWVCPVPDCITMVEVDNGLPYLNWGDHPTNPMKQ